MHKGRDMNETFQTPQSRHAGVDPSPGSLDEEFSV